MSLTTKEERRLPAAKIRTLGAWKELKTAVIDLQQLQVKDGSVPDAENHARANEDIDQIVSSVQQIQPHLPHDREDLDLVVQDFQKWQSAGLGEPDFLDSLLAFQPQEHRTNGLPHLVLFPMYTQNGSPNRFVEAVVIDVIWPEFIDELESAKYSNKLFVPIRFGDFTPGYDTNSAVLFPESVAVRSTPKFTWGGIFADREAARFRRVVKVAAEITSSNYLRMLRRSWMTKACAKRPSS